MNRYLKHIIVLINVILGAAIMYINYEPNWDDFPLFFIFFSICGNILLVLFFLGASWIVWQERKKWWRMMTFAILYSLFLINLFFNPFEIDLKKNNIFTAKMIGEIEGEFSFSRIIFDTNDDFHLLDMSFVFNQRYSGKYIQKGDTLILIADELPVNFRDTLYIQEKGKYLMFSKHKNYRPMSFLRFEHPQKKRLSVAKRTVFEIE